MKSLLITFDFPPIVSGIGTFLYNVWRYLSPDNYLILAPKVKGYEKLDKASGFRIYRYPAFSHSQLMRMIVIFFYTFYLIIQKKINVIICGVPFTLGLIGFTFKKIIKLPYIVFYYGGEYDKFKNRKRLFNILEKILQDADYIITNSEFTSQEVKRFNVDAKKVLKITPGVDIEKFRPDLDCSDINKQFGLGNKKVLLTVSRLVKRKGIDVVINALPGVIKENPDIVYLVVGTGEEEGYLKRLAREKGLEEKIIFTGYISDNELPKYYNACDIYIMPNKETKGEEIVEGFGISFIEASACAKPVIGGITGGVKEAVSDGKTGLLVEPENSEIVAEAIIQLLKNEAYAIELGKNGRERVEKEFQWEDRAQMLKELLNKI